MTGEASRTQEGLAAPPPAASAAEPRMDPEKRRKLILLGAAGAAILILLVIGNVASHRRRGNPKELIAPVAISNAEDKDASALLPLVSIGKLAKGEPGAFGPSDQEAELARLTASLKLLQARTAVVQAQQQLADLRLNPSAQDTRQLAVDVGKKAGREGEPKPVSSHYQAGGSDPDNSRKKNPLFAEVSESKPSDSPKSAVLKMGTLLDAVLVNKLVTDNHTSPVLAMVDRPYFDPLSKKLLVPSGTRILGKAEAVKYQTASRLAITFDTFQFPNGTAFYVKPDEQALEGLGIFGLQDDVNRHTARILFTAGLVGVLTGWNASQIQAEGGVSGAYSGADLMRIQADNSMAKTGEQLLSPFLNAVPTITVNEGHRMKIWISRDVPVEPYVEAPGE